MQQSCHSSKLHSKLFASAPAPKRNLLYFNSYFGFSPCAGCVHVALVFGAILGVAPAFSQSSGEIKDVTLPEIRQLEREKADRSPTEQKIGSHLLDSMKQQQNASGANGRAPVKKVDILTVDSSAAASNSSLLNSIRKSGGKIESALPYRGGQYSIRAYIPVDKIPEVAADPSVVTIVQAHEGTTNVIGIDDEGRIAHSADEARKAFHVNGSGIKIGILSDSIDDNANSLKKAFASGALNKKLLNILAGQAGEGNGEGLAMAEIIHSIVPGASIYFATGLAGQAQMAENIRELQRRGCKIIVDDVTYFAESPFQDGPVSVAVAEVSEKGVLYFSSARNSGNKKHGTSGTWEGSFSDGGSADEGDVAASGHRFHSFLPNVTVNRVEAADPNKDRVDLFWADPLGKSSNEYNLYVVGPDGHVLRSSTTSHTGTQDPYQHVQGLKQGEGIVITKGGAAAPLFLHLDTGRARLKINTDGSIRGHNASSAANAFSVAAVRVPKPPNKFSGGSEIPVEEFSSDGPRRMFFHADGTPVTPGDFSSSGGIVFEKPDIAAADGVTTSLPHGKGLNPFSGTSAAAPHAAAIAALLLSYDKTLTPDEVREFLLKSALSIDGQGRNNNAGSGIVMARQVLEAVCEQKKTSCPNSSAFAASPNSINAPSSSSRSTENGGRHH
jgi:subtilisin family serine protease